MLTVQTKDWNRTKPCAQCFRKATICTRALGSETRTTSKSASTRMQFTASRDTFGRSGKTDRRLHYRGIGPVPPVPFRFIGGIWSISGPDFGFAIPNAMLVTRCFYCCFCRTRSAVQRTHNPLVQGSSPCGPTTKSKASSDGSLFFPGHWATPGTLSMKPESHSLMLVHADGRFRLGYTFCGKRFRHIRDAWS